MFKTILRRYLKDFFMEKTMVEIEKDFNRSVGCRVREVRQALRMTREEFSRLCGISESFLAAVERGEKSITSKTLYKIGTGSHVSVDYLIFGERESFQTEMILGLLEHLDDSQRESAVRILCEFANTAHGVSD